MATTVDPHLFIVLGATGDLMHRKLMPSLHRIYTEDLADDRSIILGAALPADIDDATFRRHACQTLQLASMDDFCKRRLYYQTIGQSEAADFQKLSERIEKLEREHGLPGNRVFYLALPPAAFPLVIKRLGEAGLNRSKGWTRVVIEKPFGRDLASALALNGLVHQWFDECQVYRIDHYLGKETVQNLLAFRFANALFETVWNRDRIDSVQITVAETLGVEHRAAYYEGAGALRDMVQNHLSQLLTTTAMELPAAFDADAIRYEKAKVLRAIQPIPPENVYFAQYTAGQIDGQPVPGYREEPLVSTESQIETFVALKFEIANWRWQGVPFYLYTGKRLPRRTSQIAVTFRRPPISIFQPLTTGTIHSNTLVITLQPDEGFDLEFEVKAPGPSMHLETQSLHFRYAEAFAPLRDAYETLLLDILEGDQTLFVRNDWVETSWRLYTPLLEQRPPTHFYEAGTWGPLLSDFAWPPRTLTDSVNEARRAEEGKSS
ncbi:MAG: glucose-6-phosphate dehydrogenase [Acidobacteria bacterium]|nr:glucose-6-phosphate dehydrogenase [Acidobacteriota bacterium]